MLIFSTKKLVSNITGIIIAMALAGCTVPIEPVASFTCPTIKQYSKVQQAAAAQELRDHQADIPTVADMMSDYGSLRSGIRKACP